MAAEAMMTVDELENEVLRLRNTAQAIELRIECKAEQTGAYGTIHDVSRQHVWCVGTKIRIDNAVELRKEPSGRDTPSHTRVICRGCYSDDTIFEHSDLPAPGSLARAASIRDVSLWQRPQPPNPLLLGLTPRGYLRTGDVKLDDYFRGRNRSNVSLKREAIEGVDRYVVSYDKKNVRASSKVTYLILPSEGNSVSEMREETVAGDITFVDVTRCRNRRLSGLDAWFPVQVSFERRKNGELIAGEKLIVEVVSVDANQIKQAFSLSEIPILKAGTKVSRDSALPDPQFRDGMAVWVQNQLSQSSPAIDLDLQVEQVGSRGRILRRTIIVVSALGFLVLLGIARKHGRHSAQ
jgi:hypothetical protein